MENLDPIKGAFMSLARGAEPYVDYERLYRCKLLKQHASLNRVDIAPEDERLPLMSNIPLKLGLPGVDVIVPPGQWLTLWFSNGRPNRPRVGLWEAGESTAPIKLVIRGTVIELGAAGLQPVIDGVLTGQAKDLYSGLPHWMLGNSSRVVGAKK